MPLPFHLVDVLQVVAVAKEFQQDSDFQIVKAFIHADVAPAALALSRVPGLQFNLGDVLQVIAAEKERKKKGSGVYSS